MAKCGRCGAHVSAEAVRVLYPEAVDPEALPGCHSCCVRRDGEYVPPRTETPDYADHGNSHDPGEAPDDPTYQPRESDS